MFQDLRLKSEGHVQGMYPASSRNDLLQSQLWVWESIPKKCGITQNTPGKVGEVRKTQ